MIGVLKYGYFTVLFLIFKFRIYYLGSYYYDWRFVLLFIFQFKIYCLGSDYYDWRFKIWIYIILVHIIMIGDLFCLLYLN